MPIYEYACRECGERFDRLQAMTDRAPACPWCGGADVTRLISLASGISPGGTGRAGGGCGCGGGCACGN